jgi:transketolase
MTYELLVAADLLKEHGIQAEVLHVPTIKPLDAETILKSIDKTGRVITCEEAQINGGLGSAIAELTGEFLPVPVKRLGMQDRYGESGEPHELLKYFGLDSKSLSATIKKFVEHVPQYKKGY